jgi:lipopolysaccharide/colanic/teichoic acid biosynthesis glycosyltransferase
MHSTALADASVPIREASWAQANGLSVEIDWLQSVQGRIAHDLYYLSNWSFWFDMRIAFATIFRGSVHRNPY